MSDRILVLGAHGMLGRDVVERLGARAIGLGHGECDVTDAVQIEAALRETQPEAIVNCAAYTNVDGAEAEPETARRLNVEAVELLGRAAAKAGLHFITIGTDYVFHGRGDAPFAEDAPAADFGPESVYGRTKLEGEQRLAAVAGEYPKWGGWCVARTAWLYGLTGNNFIEAIAGAGRKNSVLRVVADQIGAPTWSRDVAEGIETLLARRAVGFYHLVNAGFAPRDEIANYILEQLGIDSRVESCLTSDYPRPAARPLNSRLSQTKYAALAGEPLRPWRAALDAYFTERAPR